MAKAIEQLRSGLTVGHVGLGQHGDGVGTVKQQVHDGDTINVRALGNLSIRFLGVDTPEVSFTVPGTEDSRFIALSDPRWERFLSEPFTAAAPDFVNALDPGLRAHLETRTGPGSAANHAMHAQRAQRELERQIEGDYAETGVGLTEFRFFLAFASEVTDRYGRLLAYVNRDDQSNERPDTYNERMLQTGFACAYFIWPNINPFRRPSALIAAVPKPGTANDVANSEASLRAARSFVQKARRESLNLYHREQGLRLEPFELRFLAQQRVPNRWVIDLGKNDDVLIRPQNYFTIPHAEDRLFVPEEFVPLFVEQGWKRQA